MEPIAISSLAYFIASGLFVALTIIFALQVRAGINHWSLPAALLVNALSFASVGANSSWLAHHSLSVLITELLRHVIWIFALSASLRFLTKNELPYNLKKLIYFSGATVAAAIAYQTAFQASKGGALYTMAWMGLLLSVICLISIEQIFKNVEQNRQIKLLCLNLTALFVYDIYLYAHSLTFNGIDLGLWQARALISLAAAAIIVIGTLTLNPKSQESATLSFSRPIAFYTTSLTASGIFILVLAAGGLYIQKLGGNWGSVFYTLFLFVVLMAVAITFVSSAAREFLSVLINKHFFSHKYDYRTEWLKLISQLSQPTMPNQIDERAFHAICDMVKSPGGGLWLRNDNQYSLAYRKDLILVEPHPTVHYESDFSTVLRKQEWVFIPNSGDDTTRARYNEYLPDWLKEIPNIWLVLPLLTEHDLYGFIALEKPKVDSSLTWEDRDLLKTVGRQVTSYLERHKQAQQLTESSQFDTFHRLSAFIMHDLKNLIAQQALVVENAAKHKDNPAFIEDAINTIDNSVSRMSGLLAKLQRNKPSEVRAISLKDTLLQASRECQTKKPIPTLRLSENDGTINADQDRLVMGISHLISNAQDSTDSSGFIDLSLKISDEMAILSIEDSGCGMDEDFIQNRLFKPFDSTKSGKGMGIGVYQAKEVITELRGTLDVSSTPGEGTTFTIKLPLT